VKHISRRVSQRTEISRKKRLENTPYKQNSPAAIEKENTAEKLAKTSSFGCELLKNEKENNLTQFFSYYGLFPRFNFSMAGHLFAY
jgi:hypothetical protein